MTILTKNAIIWMSEYLSDRLELAVNVSHCANGYLLKTDSCEFLIPSVTNSEKRVKFFEFKNVRSSSNSKKKRIYGYEAASLPSKYLETEVTEFKIDIITFIFDHLNRVEEIGSKNLDMHDRFQLKDSLSYQFGYYDEPVVDHIIEYLKDLFVRLGCEINEKRQSSILITHDVDSAYRYDFTSATRIAKFFISRIIRRDLKSLRAYILFLLSNLSLYLI